MLELKLEILPQTKNSISPITYNIWVSKILVNDV